MTWKLKTYVLPFHLLAKLHHHIVFIAVGLAWLMPQAGTNGGALQPEVTTKLGVCIIFLLQGLVLPVSAIRQALLQWPLHLFCQSTIFIWIPLLFLLMTTLLGNWLTPDLTTGFLYLALLPTTLSTAAAFTAQAGGHTVGALCNAALANLLGIFIVPVAVLYLTSQVGPAQPLLPLVRTIIVLLLLPFLLGQMLRPLVRSWAMAKQAQFTTINSYIIGFIVYTSCCNAIANDSFQAQGPFTLLLVITITAVMLLVITGAVGLAIRLLKFEPANAITALFCTSQKTLAAGVPMAQSIFAHNQQLELGIVLLPLLIYHPLQIALGGFLIHYFLKK